jgi:hypothetical protein
MQSPNDSSSPAASKSKQERIRDNQRRSRARRQEYLADLERRLRESHSLCREAHLQKSAIAELQTENGLLRHLLALSGVSPNVVETFLRQNAPTTDQNGTEIASSMRQLKPRLQALPSRVSSDESPSASAQSRARPPLRTNQNCVTTLQTGHDPHRSECFDSQGPQQIVPDWLFDLSDQQSPPSQKNAGLFCCDSFLIPAHGPLLEDERNAVVCSVARDLINQYNPPPHEMDAIKLRLSTGLSRSLIPGGPCRVNNQLLFQVLNEISAKYG